MGGGHGEAAGLRRAARHLIGSFGTLEEVAEAIICCVAWLKSNRKMMSYIVEKLLRKPRIDDVVKGAICDIG